jgi:hypothetical protein
VKLKVILGGLVIAAMGAAVAFAAPPPSNPGKGHKTTGSTSTTNGHGKGHPKTTTSGTSTTSTHGNKPACTPQVTIIVRGTANADVGTNDTSLSLNVTGGNHFAKPLFGNNTSLSVNTTNTTKVTTGNGKASALSSIDKGDRVLAMYKACKSSVTGNSPNVSSAGALSTYLGSLSPRKVVDLGNAAGQD